MQHRPQFNKAHAGFTLIELMIVVAIIGILAAIAIPQYQTYVAKSQVARVVGEAGAQKTAVEDCILNGRIKEGPEKGQCGGTATGSNLMAKGGNMAEGVDTAVAGQGVPKLTIQDTGEATIVATFGHAASTILQKPKAAKITWTRAPNGTWKCTSTDVDDKYLGSACPAESAAGGST